MKVVCTMSMQGIAISVLMFAALLCFEQNYNGFTRGT